MVFRRRARYAREVRPQLCRRAGALSVCRALSPLVGNDAGWCGAVERRGTPGITGSSPLSGGGRPSRQRLVRGLRHREVPVDADSMLIVIELPECWGYQGVLV